MRLYSPTGLWLLLLTAAVVAAGCTIVPDEGDPPAGGLYRNNSDRTVIIYSQESDGSEFRLGGAEPGTTEELEGPCQRRPLVARDADDDDAPLIDSWDGDFCEGDYWSIPSGSMIVNQTSLFIKVRALDPSSGVSYTISLQAGGTGSLRGPCADPPIVAIASNETDPLVPPVDEPLCVGDVWVIEEP